MADYINRSDLHAHLRSGRYGDRVNNSEIHAAINRIPSADVVEAKHGKWVVDEDGCLICSECGYADEINGISGEFMHSNYCASCGARMDGKK